MRFFAIKSVVIQPTRSVLAKHLMSYRRPRLNTDITDIVKGYDRRTKDDKCLKKTRTADFLDNRVRID